MLVQFHAYTGYLLHAIPGPLRTHDLADVPGTHSGLRAGDVVGGDRAFCSYAHLALLQQRRAYGLFRAHQRQIISFQPRRAHVPPGRQPKRSETGMPRPRWVRRLGRDDQIVEYFKPAECPEWMRTTNQGSRRRWRSASASATRYRSPRKMKASGTAG